MTYVQKVRVKRGGMSAIVTVRDDHGNSSNIQVMTQKAMNQLFDQIQQAKKDQLEQKKKKEALSKK